jgi:hypothetical protein
MLFKAIQDVNASTLSEEENGAEKEIETVKQKVARIAQTVGLRSFNTWNNCIYSWCH